MLNALNASYRSVAKGLIAALLRPEIGANAILVKPPDDAALVNVRIAPDTAGISSATSIERVTIDYKSHIVLNECSPLVKCPCFTISIIA